jgi:oligosaccharide repeat unit polymerase
MNDRRVLIDSGLLFVCAIIVVGGTLVALNSPVALSSIAIVGVALFLVWQWIPWSTGTGRHGGTPTFVYLAGIAIYAAGSVQLAQEAIYSSSIPSLQWVIYLCAAMLSGALLILGNHLRARRLADGPISGHAPYAAWVLWIAFAVGLGVSWVNFATGNVPLFAESINTARKEGVGGALASVSFFGYPSLQFVILAALLIPFSGVGRKSKFVLVALSVGTLLMTGSRSFLVLPLVALLCFYIESKRPKLKVIVVLSVGLVLAVALTGQLRAIGSGTEGNLAINSERYGYGSGAFSSVFSNLQPGPRVFSSVIEAVPRVVPHQTGTYFLRDFPGLVNPGQKSDYWVTDAIMGRDSSQIGGLPPTMLGGLYIDWGFAGALIGSGVVFFILSYWRPRSMSFGNAKIANLVYGFFAAYVITSFYSYLSLKVSVVMVFVWCGAVVFFSRARTQERPPHSLKQHSQLAPQSFS